MNIVLGEPIAYGRTAEIYAWHDGQILKLFYDWFRLEDIQTEASNTRAVQAAGLPVPTVGEIVQVDGRYGLEYQRVDGVSMWKLFQHKPWTFLRCARRLSELQAALHTSTLQVEFPSQRKILESNIQNATALPPDLRRKALAALEALPDGDRVCHGDFWAGNILVTAQGEMIIDWLRAARGNPLADLARTTNLTLGFTRTSQGKRPFLSYEHSRTSMIKNSLIKNIVRLIYPVYLKYYFDLCPGGREEYRRWLPVVAAARLADNIPELEALLVAQVEAYL